VQEGIHQNTKDGSSSKHDEKENFSLASKAKKGKGKSSHSKSYSSQGGKNKYMSKVKCFHCHGVRNFARKCLLKKVGKKRSGGAKGEILHHDSIWTLPSSLVWCH